MIAFLPARIGVFDAMRALTPCAALWLAAAAHGGEFVAPYVDTVEDDGEMILELAGVGPGDYQIDLGAGDGRFVIGAAQRGALAHGVELSDPVERARANAERAGVSDRTRFEIGDLFKADISMATVVTIYLFPEANIALPSCSRSSPATVISNSFHTVTGRPMHEPRGARPAARCSGSFRQRGRRLALRDAARPCATHDRAALQRIDARVEINGALVPLESAVLRGDVLQCVAAGGTTLHGRTARR